MSKKTHVLVAVDGGFWVSGIEAQAPEGFVYLDEAVMLYGFSGPICDIADGKSKPDATQGSRQDRWVIPEVSVKLIIPSVEIKA